MSKTTTMYKSITDKHWFCQELDDFFAENSVDIKKVRNHCKTFHFYGQSGEVDL